MTNSQIIAILGVAMYVIGLILYYLMSPVSPPVYASQAGVALLGFAVLGTMFFQTALIMRLKNRIDALEGKE